ncbi:MAG: DUF4388 domain-containing protein, partial [Deltaproteobacteria bacterium]|nr:DUF4388 domain-containing protein [Deltaproteobacteria bacterium]
VVPSDEVAVDRSEHGVAFEFEAYPGAELAIATPSSDAGEPAAFDASEALFAEAPVPEAPVDAPSADASTKLEESKAHLPLWDNVIDPEYQFGAVPELELELDDQLELDIDHGALTPESGTELELDSGLEVNAAHHIRPPAEDLIDQAIVSAQLPVPGRENKPDFAGKLPARTVAKVLFRFGLANESGLLTITGPEATGPQAEHWDWIRKLRADLTRQEPQAKHKERSCEIRLDEGQPQLIAADRSEEALAAHLIIAGHIEREAIEDALRAHSHRGVIAALLTAGVLSPLHISRHVTAYVLEMVLDTFSWEEGSFAFYRGREPEHQSFPSGLDLMELLHRGVQSIPEPFLDRYIDRLGPVHVGRAETPPAQLDTFVPNQLLRHLYQLLAGATIAETLQRGAVLGPPLALKRALYTLVECELAELTLA